MSAEGAVDVYVRERFFKSKTAGVFIEVGAARPDFLSISQSFRKMGWKIISIEPNPAFCEAHRQLGYEVLEYAASDENGDDIDFFVVDSTGHSYAGEALSFESFSSLGLNENFKMLFGDADESRIRKIPVKVRRLDTILASHAPEVKEIDVLAIDVEGWELQVLRGLDFSRHRPGIVILENVFQERAYEDAMVERGYERCNWIYPNEVYANRTPSLTARRVLRRLMERPYQMAKSLLPPSVQQGIRRQLSRPPR